MSLVEEPAQNDVMKVPEIRLQDDEVTNECVPKDQKDKTTNKRPVSPLSFLREDFSQFKEDLLKVFWDKDADQSGQAASSHEPLKGDSSRFKVAVASVFESADPKSSQSAEKPINRLSFLNFKDISNVFRLETSQQTKEDPSDAFKIKASSKERDNKGVTAKEDPSDAFKIKASSDTFRLSPSKERDHKGATAKEDSSDAFKIKAERTDEPFLQSLFRKTSQKVENSPEIKKIISETSQQTKEEMDAGYKGNVSEQNEETVGAEKINNLKDAVNEMEVAKTTSLSETQHGEETINWLSFLNFKDVANVFRLSPSKERDNKGATAKEDPSDTFKIKAERAEEPFLQSLFKKTSQKVENGPEIKKIISETSQQTKEDSSDAFKIKASSKEGDNKGTTEKEDSSDAFKIKAERTDEPFLQSLFRKTQKVEIKKIISETSEQTKEEMDAGYKGNVSEKNKETIGAEKINNLNEVESLFRKTSQKVESAPEIKKIISVTSQFAGFKGNVSEQNEETDDAEKLKNNLKDMMKELEVAETTSLSEAHHGEEMIPTSRAAEQRCETEESSESADDDRMNKEDAEQEEEEEEKPSETLPLQPLSSEIDLFSLRDQDDERGRPGGISWTVKSFACYLTFDPNTANSELRLSDSNRTVTREWTALWPPEHPDRFRRCPQVLCREGLLDSAYWEVEWRGGADIGVAYNDNCRDGDAARCLLGHNERSWSLECSEGSYAACHANRRFRAAVAAPEPFARRVGVHLDWSAGALSFYCISPDAMVHLHTFRDTFTEPLYPAFWVWAYDGAVSLSQVELGWERLLQ
ncbi:hypothetical protein PFLUV_G00105470 [Perca fluviatilis]|uniref:B30.2/SPRY domain-containing protein n=1 Tax=Perca fluviatilis TaxID=8168 RepID=A0A6A5EWK2_PERFL|nr:hypothetical protein PFLUV_G00105470 [Perca fluviatilis]